MSSKPVITVEGVGKSFRSYARPSERLRQLLETPLRRGLGLPAPAYGFAHEALRDVSFTVERGETVGIIGRNGSGKSTLLQIICGTMQPTTGWTGVQGRVCALLELGAGFSPEFTGLENVLLAGRLLGLEKAELEQALPQIEAFADIGAFIHQPVKIYSSGMFVRLAFATQAFARPDVLIVDEALAVGDAPFQAKCLARLEELRAAGTSILFVSHDTSAVRRFCDRAIWLEMGQVRAIGSVAEVTSAYVEFLFGSPEVSAAPAITAPAQAEPPPTVLAPEWLLGAPNHRPFRRWGSQPGLVKAALFMDAEGQAPLAEATLGQPVQITVLTDLPEGLSPESLAVSFALKDSKGSDMVIGSSWDDPTCRFSPGQRTALLRFHMPNWLNEGEYHLVVALEERSGTGIVYFDFVEGAAWLRTHTPQRRWGLFLPPVQVEMRADDAQPGSLAT